MPPLTPDIGSTLRGLVCEYEIIGKKPSGAYGQVYDAKPIGAGRGRLRNRNVIIKVPRLPEGITPARAMDLLPQLLASFAKEKMALDTLARVDGVAHALDIGLHALPFDQTRVLPVAFLVQDNIPGTGLKEWISKRHPLVAPQFFGLAKKLVTCLVSVHQFGIVHGDLWPNNIIITPADRPVLIDFGQAGFRDLYIAYGVRDNEKSHPYIAPEKTATVEGDIYSLGAVFYYLATGQDPPNHLPVDMDEVKGTILDNIRGKNRKLYEHNCGVVDIIARCLRQAKDRTPHAQAVLQDLRLFSDRL